MYLSSPFLQAKSQRALGLCVCPHSVRDPPPPEMVTDSQSFNTKPCDLKCELLTKLRTKFNPPDLFYPCGLEYLLAAEALLSAELSQPQNPRTCLTKWGFFLIHWQDDSNLHRRYKSLTYQMRKPSEVGNESGCLNRKVVYKVFPWL